MLERCELRDVFHERVDAESGKRSGGQEPGADGVGEDGEGGYEPGLSVSVVVVRVGSGVDGETEEMLRVPDGVGAVDRYCHNVLVGCALDTRTNRFCIRCIPVQLRLASFQAACCACYLVGSALFSAWSQCSVLFASPNLRLPSS